MASKHTIAGTLYLTISGKRYDLTGDFSFDPGGVVREGVNDCNGTGIGWTVSNKNGSFDATFASLPDLSVRDIEALEDAPMQLELANGRRFVSDTLYCLSVDEINPLKGEIRAKFGTLGAMREV